MKAAIKKLLKKSLFILLFSLLLTGLGFLAALLISNHFHYFLQDVVFYEGLILVLIGILMSMKGNPSIIIPNALDQPNSEYLANLSLHNIEVTLQERKDTEYYKNFFKQSVIDFAFSSFTVLFSGIMLVAVSYILSR